MQRIQVLLSNVEGALNLGSIARAMANTGFTELRFTGNLTGQEPEARMLAVHAGNILDTAHHAESFAELLSTADVVIGLSPRTPWDDGREITLDELPAIIRQHHSEGRTIGLLFGNEAMGLGNDELSQCRYRLPLPTHEGYVSMNLAQAVMVVLWEVYRFTGESTENTETKSDIAPSHLRRAMLQKLRQFLEAIDYLDPQNPELVWREIAILFESRDFSTREMTLLTSFVNKAKSRYQALAKKLHDTEQFKPEE